MGRAGVLVLCLAFAARAAAAGEIPAKYLQQEQKMRATMTPNAKAHVSSFTSRLNSKMSVADVRMLTQGQSNDTLFLVMLEYLKLLEKEARETRQLAQSSAQLGLNSKSSKIQADQKKLDDQRREAEKRFDSAMQAANAEMIMGVVSGATSVLGAVGGTGGGGAAAGGPRLGLTPTPAPVSHAPTPAPQAPGSGSSSTKLQ